MQDMDRVVDKENQVLTSPIWGRKSYGTSKLGDESGDANVEVRRQVKPVAARILRETTTQGQVPDLVERRRRLKKVIPRERSKASLARSYDTYTAVNQRSKVPEMGQGDANDFFEDDEEKILKQYKDKKRQLEMLQKQTEVVNFELIELASKLERAKSLKEKAEQPQRGAFDIKSLTKKASTVFNASGHLELARKASTIIGNGVANGKHVENVSEYINRFQESLQSNETSIKAFISKSTNELDELSNKTSQLVTSVMDTFYSRNKKIEHENDCINSSFNFENLSMQSHDPENTIVNECEQNDCSEVSVIDIDQYESDEN